MSSVRLELQGLDEFRRALHNLPEDLTNEAADIVLAHANEAGREVVSGYPQGPTGNLRRMVTVLQNRSLVSTSALVRSRAPHASIFERGSKARRTGKGWNRGWMPAASEQEAAIPKFVRIRRRMVQALIEVVRKAGLIVETQA